MNKWMKVVIGLIIGIVALSIIGVAFKIVAGLMSFVLKAIVVIAVVYFAVKTGKHLIKKFR